MFGQLGLGNNTDENTPQQVGSKSNWLVIACGQYSSAAINSDGKLFSWGSNMFGILGLGNTTSYNIPQQTGSDSNWIKINLGMFHALGIKTNGTLWTWGYGLSAALGHCATSNEYSPKQVGSDTNWFEAKGGDYHSVGIKTNGTLWAWGAPYRGRTGTGTGQAWVSCPTVLSYGRNFKYLGVGREHTIVSKSIKISVDWIGSNNITSISNWSTSSIPNSTDSAIILSGTMTINQATTLDAVKINNNSTVKLTAPLTVRNLHLNNGTIDLNGHRLTITGGIYQSTDSSNYYIQAGTAASPKPNSELVFAPTANTSSTIYFNPSANTMKVFELGTETKTAQINLGNSVNIKGGKTPSNVGSLKIINGSKIIIPNGASLTLQSDTFNAYLDLATPAQRAIHCSGTGTFNIERQHYGARGWRL
jgi:alpha-tubulin suppressor-like RCC1 family protein